MWGIFEGKSLVVRTLRLRRGMDFSVWGAKTARNGRRPGQRKEQRGELPEKRLRLTGGRKKLKAYHDRNSGGEEPG